MIQPADLKSPLSPQWEFAAALFILMAFLLVNLAVATRTPTVFCDEPGYTDPAANLYFGAGFTSTMWGQDRHDFWCGNVPLYQGILYCFFKIFGFGLFQVRALNTFLAGAGAFLLWFSLRRTGFIRRPANRLICLTLILSGSVSTLTFRTGRYDATMFFVCTLVFFACCLPDGWRSRYIFVGLFSALLPVAGVPMIPYAGLMLLINVAVFGFANISLLVFVAVGLLAGIAGLVAFYNHFSTFRNFAEIVLPFTAVGGSGHSGVSFWHTKIFGQAPGDDTLFTSFFGNPVQFLDQKTLFDYSAALLFLLVILIALKGWRSADAGQRKFIIFIIATTLIIPPVMHLAGHYRSFYRWMTYIPLAIAVPRILEIQWDATQPGFLRRCVLAGTCLSVFMGVPLRTLAILPRWSERSITPLEQVTAKIAQPSDVAVCDFKVYFAVRPRVKLLYACGLPARGEFSRTKNLPVSEVTLLCLFPDQVKEAVHFKEVVQIVGGKWKKVPLAGIPGADAFGKTRYAVDFYRRDSD